MTKTIYSTLLTGITLLAGLLPTACSVEKADELLKKVVVAPPAYIERDIKGHEQIYSWQVILRLARKGPSLTLADGLEVESYRAYDLGHKETPIPLYQDITYKKDDEGNITISSERKAFEVVKSPDFGYAMEIKYYDANGMLINHQFAQYDPADQDNSTLSVHQHFFAIRNNALDGHQLVYPMSLDSLYYDRFLFADDHLTPARVTSTNGIYVPEGYTIGSDAIRYRPDLAQRAVESTMTAKATDLVTVEDTDYRLTEILETKDLNERVPELFTYEYRDTDPVDEELGELLEEVDDLGRNRAGGLVVPLKQKRNYLDSGADDDQLGFKGLIRFQKADVCFQMRVCICHIQDKVQTPAGLTLGKYANTIADGGLYRHYQLQPSWNTFDIDYPVPFIVLGDTEERETCKAHILKYYSARGRQVSETDLDAMLWGDGSYFSRMPSITF